MSCTQPCLLDSLSDVKISISASYSGELQQSDRCSSWSSRSEWEKAFLTSGGIIYIYIFSLWIKCRNQINGWKSTAEQNRWTFLSHSCVPCPAQSHLPGVKDKKSTGAPICNVQFCSAPKADIQTTHTMCGKTLPAVNSVHSCISSLQSFASKKLAYFEVVARNIE